MVESHQSPQGFFLEVALLNSVHASLAKTCQMGYLVAIKFFPGRDTVSLMAKSAIKQLPGCIFPPTEGEGKYNW